MRRYEQRSVFSEKNFKQAIVNIEDKDRLSTDEWHLKIPVSVSTELTREDKKNE